MVLIATGFFYLKIVLSLKRGRDNSSRKRTLTYTFICLWVFWFLQSAPFALYDFYEVWAVSSLWVPTKGLGPLMAFDFVFMDVNCLLFLSQYARFPQTGRTLWVTLIAVVLQGTKINTRIVQEDTKTIVKMPETLY